MKNLVILSFILVAAFSFLSFQKKPPFDLKASINRGKEIYIAYCISCHMEQGEGIDGVYPPLAKSDYLMADKRRSISQVLNGANGSMKVKGVLYNAEMSGFDLTDQETSDVLNYVRNSFGNKGEAVRPEEVKAVRK
jgi:mono/diheme cytochrome c family protein